MNFARLLFVSLCALAIVRLTFAEEPKPMPGKQVEVKHEAYNYLLFVPAQYEGDEKKDKKWPLVVFLHGAGERGEDLSLVKKHGPPKMVDSQPDFEAIVVSPQVPKEKRWEPEKVVQIIDELSKSLRIDQDRIYLTGLSMGGYGTWATAAKYPDRFAAIVPICGGGDPGTAEKFAKVPCWVFHGTKDTAVVLAKSEEMVAALKKAGGEPKFTMYPNAGHDSWTESYANPELWKWLLAQKRGSQTK